MTGGENVAKAEGRLGYFLALAVLATKAVNHKLDQDAVELNLEPWNGRSMLEVSLSIRHAMEQDAIKEKFHQGLLLLGKYPEGSLDFSYVADFLEPYWFALLPENRN